MHRRRPPNQVNTNGFTQCIQNAEESDISRIWCHICPNLVQNSPGVPRRGVACFLRGRRSGGDGQRPGCARPFRVPSWGKRPRGRGVGLEGGGAEGGTGTTASGGRGGAPSGCRPSPAGARPVRERRVRSADRGARGASPPLARHASTRSFWPTRAPATPRRPRSPHPTPRPASPAPAPFREVPRQPRRLIRRPGARPEGCAAPRTIPSAAARARDSATTGRGMDGAGPGPYR